MHPSQDNHGQAKPGGMIEDAKQALAFLLFASQVITSPIEPILRTGFGRRYFGLPSFFGLFALPLWMLFWPEQDSRPIWGLWCLFIVMQLYARIQCVLMGRQGQLIHTRYNGFPRLGFILRRTHERILKGNCEPMLVMGVGLFVMNSSPPLGSYLFTAGICLAINLLVLDALERARVMDMNDALIEQESLAERLREQRDEHH